MSSYQQSRQLFLQPKEQKKSSAKWITIAVVAIILTIIIILGIIGLVLFIIFSSPSSSSSELSSTPPPSSSNIATPSEPKDVNVKGCFPTLITISWTEPDDSGDAPITGYRIRFYNQDESNNYFIFTSTTTDTSLDISIPFNNIPFEPNTSWFDHVIKISAVNIGGEGDLSSNVLNEFSSDVTLVPKFLDSQFIPLYKTFILDDLFIFFNHIVKIDSASIINPTNPDYIGFTEYQIIDTPQFSGNVSSPLILIYISEQNGITTYEAKSINSGSGVILFSNYVNCCSNVNLITVNQAIDIFNPYLQPSTNCDITFKIFKSTTLNIPTIPNTPPSP